MYTEKLTPLQRIVKLGSNMVCFFLSLLCRAMMVSTAAVACFSVLLTVTFGGMSYVSYIADQKIQSFRQKPTNEVTILIPIASTIVTS